MDDVEGGGGVVSGVESVIISRWKRQRERLESITVTYHCQKRVISLVCQLRLVRVMEVDYKVPLVGLRP